MKVVLAGAYGNLGADIFKVLLKEGHEVVAADMKERDIGVQGGNYTFKQIDATKPETMKGMCDGADVVITTVGLTGTSATVTNYDIDLNGNLNILREAQAAGVKNFTYISVIKADKVQIYAAVLINEEVTVDLVAIVQPFLFGLHERAERRISNRDAEMFFGNVNHVKLPAAFHDLRRPEPAAAHDILCPQAIAAVLPYAHVGGGENMETVRGIGGIQIIGAVMQEHKRVCASAYGILIGVVHKVSSFPFPIVQQTKNNYKDCGRKKKRSAFRNCIDLCKRAAISIRRRPLSLQYVNDYSADICTLTII